MNWEQIYRKYLSAMIAAASWHVRERPDLDAADVVHDAFVAALSEPPTDEPDWQEYLVRLIAEVCARCPQRILDETGLPDLDLEADDDPEAIAVRRLRAREIRLRVVRVMDYMTDRQREITRLRLFDGLSVGEIATMVDTSSSNISQIVIRCLTKLAPILIQLDLLNEHDLEHMRPPRRVH